MPSTIRLSSGQQRTLWELWLGAEIRALYFADLAGRFRWRQSAATWMTLVFSSSATAGLLAGLPTGTAPLVTFLVAGLSLYMLIAQNHTRSTDGADLHFRWHTLATECGELWERLYEPTALADYQALLKRDAELSKSSVPFPVRKDLLVKWQDYVERRHAA